MERLDPNEQLKGYEIPDQQSAERLLEIEADLLRSEGIDPTWPRFERHRRDQSPGRDK